MEDNSQKKSDTTHTTQEPVVTDKEIPFEELIVEIRY